MMYMCVFLLGNFLLSIIEEKNDVSGGPGYAFDMSIQCANMRIHNVEISLILKSICQSYITRLYSLHKKIP